MKSKILAFLLLIVFAVPLFAGQPTVTRANGISHKRYKSVIHTFTGVTGVADTILVQLLTGSRAVAFETADLEVNRTVFVITFQTDEATANDSDFDVLWQVSGQPDASNAAFPGMVVAEDWHTVELDQNDDSLDWVATFDAQNYKGMKVQAVLCEVGTPSKTPAIEVTVLYPRN